ncbi:MAG: hypothetical protein CMB80_15680 [Flammeovirgaceae bacterium]|nr:hypothetical protein [Flammeovirgaceae bacterium]MBE61375.1 hypothetical protein [Flammeovirgaceae bacterium]
MMSMTKKFAGACAIFILLHVQVIGQSSTGSAYNAFGFGSLIPVGSTEFSSLGYTGVGARFSNVVNLENPAALTSIKGPNHIFDLGLNITGLNQKSSSKSYSTVIGGLSAMNFWVRSGKSSAFNFSLSQYSDAKYDITDFSTSSSLLGAYSVRYQGNGGLSKLAVAYTQDLFPRLSLGFRGGLVFGNITRSQELSGNSLIEGTSISQEMNLAQLVYDVGLQYSVPLGEAKSMTLGLTYQPAFSVGYDIEQEILKEGYDTLHSESDDSQSIPEKIGVGFHLTLGQWSIMADGEVEKWGVNEGDASFDYTDLRTFSGGLVYQANDKLELYANRVIYRAGYRFGEGYVDALSTTFQSHRFSLGFGLPVRRNTGYINLGYSYQQQGKVGTRLIEEQLHTLSLSISIRDVWFTKRVYD